jgi:hypothetical protein
VRQVPSPESSPGKALADARDEAAPGPADPAALGLVVAAAAPWPPERGAAQADLMLSRLRCEGVRVRRATTWTPPPPLLAALPSLADSWARSRVRRSLDRALRADANVLHVHAGRSGELVAGASAAVEAARAAGMRVVVRWDGDVLFPGARTGPGDADLARTLRAANAVVVATLSAADAVRSEFGLRPVVIPNLVPDPPATPPPARGEGPLRVTVARRLVDGCGVDVALRAAEIAVRRGCDLHVDVVGDGPARTSLQRTAREGLGPRVRFHGFVSRSDLLRRLSNTDLLLDGAGSDDVPAVFSEALSRGVPVVAAHAHRAPGVVEHGRTGFVVEPGDSDALAACVGALAHDRDLLEEFGWSAKMAALRWTWAALRDAWFATWRPGARSVAA